MLRRSSVTLSGERVRNPGRRALIQALGTSTALLPCAYLLSSEAVGSSTVGKQQASTSKNSFFLTRDFNSTRLELVRLLKEVTEIEHALMLQYIYGAYSLKPKYEKIMGTGAPVSTDLLGIAVQEMKHLGAINRLLVSLGSSPNMDVQDFPYEPDIYPTQMDLEPLSKSSLAKYVYAEAAPSELQPASGKSVEDRKFIQELHLNLDSSAGVNHVGSVYALVISLLEKFAESSPNAIDDVEGWLATLTEIMREGEEDHYGFLRQLFLAEHPVFEGNTDVWNLPVEHVDYPAYKMATNPSAYKGHAGEIEHQHALALAWLGNLHYWSVLMLMDFYYRYGNNEVRVLAQTTMMSQLQAVGRELPKLGYGLPFDRLSMGYAPFQQEQDNLLLVASLQEEASVLVNKLGEDLPPMYPKGMEKNMIARVNSIATTWAKNKSVGDGIKVTSINTGRIGDH